MLKTVLSLLLVALIGVPALPQATEVELVRTAFKLDKKEKVADFMNLPDSTAKKFWPLYNQYETERTALGDRRVKMLEEYATNFENLTPGVAQKLWKESALLQKSETTLREKYANLIRTKISSKVALNFYMIEDYIATAVKHELYNSIPPPKD